MKNQILNLVLFALVLQVGCTQVYIDKPIGKAWTKKQQSQLLGRWTIENDESAVYEVQRNKAGDLSFAIMNWDADKQKFELHQGLMTVTHLGENDFAFIDVREATKAAQEPGEKDDAAADGLIPCKIEVRDDTQVEFIYFKTKLMAKAVLESKLPGKVINQDADETEPDDRSWVLLSAADEQVTDFFKSPDVVKYLDQKATIKLKRLGNARAAR